MKIKKIINNVIHEYLKENDNYAEFKGVKPYKERMIEFENSIKTFKDFDDEKIRKSLEFFGWEGFNSEEEAFKDLKDRINFYKQMPNPSIMYRVVGVKDKKND